MYLLQINGQIISLTSFYMHLLDVDGFTWIQALIVYRNRTGHNLSFQFSNAFENNTQIIRFKTY